MSTRNSITISGNGSISGKSEGNRNKKGNDGSSVDSYSSESDNDTLRKNLRIDDSILYCEKCDFKTGNSFKSCYTSFGITSNSLVFFGAFSVKKKRKIVPLKNICGVEWQDDDSVKVVLPMEKGKFKNYNIIFKKSHKGSPFRLIESRWISHNIDPSRKLSTGEELYRNPSTLNLLRHFQHIPRDERLELSYRCRIKGSFDQNYGVMFVTQTRILFLSIDTTYKSEEIKFEKVIDIRESLPSKGKIKKSILIAVGKDQVYSFSSFESKEESFDQIKYSWETFKKFEEQQIQLQKQQFLKEQHYIQQCFTVSVALPLPSSEPSSPPPGLSPNPLANSQQFYNPELQYKGTTSFTNVTQQEQLQQQLLLAQQQLQQSQAIQSPISSSSSTYGSNNSLEASEHDIELEPQSPQSAALLQPSSSTNLTGSTYNDNTYNNFNNNYNAATIPNVYKKVQSTENINDRANRIFKKEPESKGATIKEKIIKIKNRGCCSFFY